MLEGKPRRVVLVHRAYLKMLNFIYPPGDNRSDYLLPRLGMEIDGSEIKIWTLHREKRRELRINRNTFPFLKNIKST